MKGVVCVSLCASLCLGASEKSVTSKIPSLWAKKSKVSKVWFWESIHGLYIELHRALVSFLSSLAYASRTQFASAWFESNTPKRFRRHTAPASLRI